MARAPDPFLASAGFAEILRAAGLGDVDMDAFRMLEEARQLVVDGEMDADEYEQLAKGVQLQLLQLATGGSIKAMPAHHAEGKSQPKPSTVELPKDKPIVESYLQKLPVANSLVPKVFKKRYVVLYKTCLLYYTQKGDKQPKGRIDLNSDFFVQDSTAHAHGFVLSDMTTTITLAADTEELKGYWVHMCAMVLRKLQEHEQPVDMISSDEDEASRIQREFDKKLQKFKKEKANRRQSLFFRKKVKEEDVIREATETAVAHTTKELREREIHRQRELEDLQKKLDVAEEERNKYKSEAAHEHERAEREAARATEEEQRRAEAERRLNMSLEELRVEAQIREQALLDEKDEIQAKLNAVNIKRRQSAMPGTAAAGSSNSAEAEKWDKERKALEAKLHALMDALNVDLGNLEWDGTLEDAEQKMKDLVPALCSEDEKVAREAQAKFDQYDKVIRNHSDYKAREEQKWVKWEEDNAPKNQRALDEMKRIVPHEVMTGISLEFLTQQCHLSHDVGQRIVKTKILQFLYMDSEVIAKTHIADLSSRFVPQGLDIRELRAIYACLPKEFQLDSDGRKKLWRDEARSKLFAMTEKEKNNNLPKNEQLAAAYRPKEDKKPSAGASPGGGGVGGARPANPMAGALGAMFAGRGGPPAAGGGDAKPNPGAALGALFAGRGGPPGSGPPGPKLDTSALQNALAAKLGGGGPRAPNPMLQHSAEMAEKEEKKKETADLLAVVKKSSYIEVGSPGARPPPLIQETEAPASPVVAKAAPPALPQGKPTPAPGSEKKSSLLPSSGSSRKLSTLPEKPAPSQERKPMIDLGIKFNAPPEKKEPEGLIGSDARELFDKARTRQSKTITEDEFEGDVPAYDFEANYYATQKRKTWVDDGINKLSLLIEQHGAPDKAEGGKKSATFGKIYENFGNNSDMLVGILMRARKKGKIKYVGDMLFKGVHDDVKITLL